MAFNRNADQQDGNPRRMRIAVFSDIHGNSIALDAVLADISERGGVDAYWVLGDLVAIGADPVGTLERLAALPNALFVQGNTERYLVTGERPYPSMQDTLSDPRLLPRLVAVAHSFAWTQGAVTSSGWFDWLAALPTERRTTLPDGTRVLLTHVAPGANDGPGLHPAHSDAVLAEVLSRANADLVCVGHTHWPMERKLGSARLINDGSVSNPWSPDLRASYVLIDADDSTYQVQLRRVAYDHTAAIESVRRAHHPAGDFIVGWLAGERAPWWTRESGQPRELPPAQEPIRRPGFPRMRSARLR
jgi:putative phosphoesterase